MSFDTMEETPQEDGWILVGGCHGCSLVPRSQYPDYLRAQGWVMLLALLSAPLLLAMG